MIYKNIISFTILYFTDVFKRHFEIYLFAT